MKLTFDSCCAYMAVCCKARFLYYFLCSLRHLQKGVGWCTFFVLYGYPLHKSYHKDLGHPRETSFHLHLKAITKPTRKEQKDGNKSLTVTFISCKRNFHAERKKKTAQNEFIHAIHITRISPPELESNYIVCMYFGTILNSTNCWNFKTRRMT